MDAGGVEPSMQDTVLKSFAAEMTKEAAGDYSICQRYKELFHGWYDRMPQKFFSVTEPILKFVKASSLFLSELSVDSTVLHFTPGSQKNNQKILYIGKKKNDLFLKEFFADEHLECAENKRVLCWKLKNYLENVEGYYDLIIIHLNPILFYCLSLKVALKIPESLKSVQYFDRMDSLLPKNISQNVLRKKKKIQQAGFDCHVFADESFLDHFYYVMYVPYLKERYKGRAIIESYVKVRRILGTGFFLVIRRGEKVFAAALCRIRSNFFVLELIGVENGDTDLLQKGVLDTIYYYCLQHALAKECRGVDFGLSRPFLSDGLLRYKKKWGAALLPNPKQYRVLGVRSGSQAYSGFLSRFPVFFDQGYLSGYIWASEKKTVNMQDMKHIQKAYFNPGLRRMFIHSEWGFTAEVQKKFGSTTRKGTVPLFGPFFESDLEIFLET